MKQMKASLSAMEDQDNSFHYYGSPVRLVQACLCKDFVTLFYQPRRSCEARVGLFMCQRISREQISPL